VGFLQFIVMFRARFSDALPKSLPHYGPQDIERGVQDTVPGEHIERLLCALIGLVLNRKKEVEYVCPCRSRQHQAFFFFCRNVKLTGNWEYLEKDTIRELWRKRFKRILRNGPGHGEGRILCMEVARLLP
jgi:hypothetical protein